MIKNNLYLTGIYIAVILLCIHLCNILLFPVFNPKPYEDRHNIENKANNLVLTKFPSITSPTVPTDIFTKNTDKIIELLVQENLAPTVDNSSQSQREYYQKYYGS